MAVTATTPPLTELPPPPLPTDAEATFDAKAGASLTAQVQMVTQINVALTWQAASMAATLDYKNAAATSATASANSASTANTAKLAAQQAVTDASNAGAQQVQLAQQQVTLAVAAKDSAQTAAAAAQAAAGLPSIVGKAYMALRVNAAANGVEWAPGVPNVSAGKTGQSVMLGADKVPYWGYAGQQIGDTLMTARNPGTLYLPADGSVRLQSAYPALFAMVGLTGGVVGSSWTTFSPGFTTFNIVSGANGTALATISGATIYRSADKGLSWNGIASGASATPTGSLATNGQGVWMTAVGAANKVIVSIDDGFTWIEYNGPSFASEAAQYSGALVFVGNNTWLLASNLSTTIGRSTDNGKTWSKVTHGFPQYGITASIIASDENGTVCITYSNQLRRSVDYGLSFNPVTIPVSNNVLFVATDKSGDWLLGSMNTSNYANTNCRSIDNGSSFFNAGMTQVVNASLINPMFAEGLYFFFQGSALWTLNPLNGLYAQRTGAPGNSTKLTSVGSGILLQAVGASYINKSFPSYPYDSATQFKLPMISAASGTKAYIKALEAA